MKTSLVLALGIAGIGVVGTWLRLEPAARKAAAPAAPPSVAEATAILAGVPAAFVPNLGQWEHPARFVAQIGGAGVFLEEGGFAVSVVERGEGQGRGGRRRALPEASSRGPDPSAGGGEEPVRTVRGAAVRMRFEGARAAEITGEERLAGENAYFLGNDPSRRKSGVPRFGAVRYRGAWPGVDVVCYGREGHLEYDVVLAPGAALERVELAVEGAQALRLDKDGALVIETAVGPLRQPRPKTFEVDSAGRRREIAARFELRGSDRFGFAVPEWAGECSLVVDPGLLWSTFVGGNVADVANALSVDASGVVTIAGNTSSPAYPTTPGAWDTTHNGGLDVFVTRLDPSLPTSQQLLYSTYVGGSDYDWAYALSVDASGVVTIVGATDSSNYPTTQGAWDTTHNGNTDVFVTRLDPSQPSTRQIVYSTFVGGSEYDYALGLSVDASGVVTIAGATSSSSYPTTPGAWDTTYGGGGDGFVTRLDPSKLGYHQLLYSTFVGGSIRDEANAVAVDVAGVVTIAGWTWSPTYPTTPGAWDTTHNGNTDVFVTRLDPSQPSTRQIVYSTFVGGANYDLASALSVDASGVTTIAGDTSSPDYPTTPGAWDTTHHASSDAFVTRLDPTLPSSQQLVYSTFVGGSSADKALGLAVDASGVVTIAGNTSSSSYPTTLGAWDTTHNGNDDVFVTRLDPSLPTTQQNLYSTFVGGSARDNAALALSVDWSGVVTIAGQTQSLDYPTTPAAWDTTHNGSIDVFVTRLDMLPTGASPYGASTPGCAGRLAIGVTSMPRVGNQTFALTCGNAPPSTMGVLALTGSRFQTPLILLGVQVWVDPSLAFVPLLATSNRVGASRVPAPIPDDQALAGARLFAQFVWRGPSSPPPCPSLGFSASNALEITIQP